MPLHRLLISLTLISSWTSANLVMPKDKVVGKENYLQMINVPEFNCLKLCALKMNIEPPRDDEPADNRPFNSKCENLDLHSSCKIPTLQTTTLWSGGFAFHPVEGGQVWVETGTSVNPTLVNNGNKAMPNTALSFTVDPASRKLRWMEEPTTKPNSFVCAVPDECFTQRCMAS
ncbi:hypothetical protein B566_EDAN009306 [Ephemera danica]|nr:hypothetical protein B566_EDAN009306 [Ephemera danica]